MFEEYDSFRLIKEIPGESLPEGITGVVVMVFISPERAYEVEFPDGKGGNQGSQPTFTLTEDFMAPLESPGRR